MIYNSILLYVHELPHLSSRYWNDLDIAVDTILKTFDSLSEQFSLMEDEIDSAPRQLGSNRSVQFSNDELNDALVYLYDTFSSLVSLFYFCGPTSSVFLAQGVLQRLVNDFILFIFLFS